MTWNDQFFHIMWFICKFQKFMQQTEENFKKNLNSWSIIDGQGSFAMIGLHITTDNIQVPE